MNNLQSPSPRLQYWIDRYLALPSGAYHQQNRILILIEQIERIERLTTA